MPPSNVSVKDLPPVPPKTRVVSESGFSIHKEPEHTQSPPSYTYKSILNKSLANQTHQKVSTNPPLVGSRNGTPFTTPKNRISKFIQLETHPDITRNISGRTSVSRQNSTSRIGKPSRTKSVDKYRAQKEDHLLKLAGPRQFNNCSLDVSRVQVPGKSSKETETEGKHTESQRNWENVQQDTNLQANSTNLSIALDGDLDVSMNSVRSSFSKANNKETTHGNIYTVQEHTPDDASSIYSVLIKEDNAREYPSEIDLRDSNCHELSESSIKTRNVNDVASSRDKHTESLRSCPKEDTSDFDQLQTDSNTKEVDENQIDNLEYVIINDLLYEYTQYDTALRLKGNDIGHNKQEQESGSGNWESLPRSDVSSIESQKFNPKELSAELLAHPKEQKTASYEETPTEVRSKDMHGYEPSPNVTRRIIVDDDEEIDSLFSDMESQPNKSLPRTLEIRHVDPSSQFQSTISIPHSTISALNYIYDGVSVHDSMFSNTGEEEECLGSPTYEPVPITSSSIEMKKLRSKHSSQPSSAQCSSDSHMTATSSTHSMSMQDSMSKLKKYVQQRPYSFCLGDNKDYESSRYVSPNALAKPKFAGYLIDSSPGEFDANIHSIPGEHGKRYFTTTGNLGSYSNHDKKKVDKFVAEKNLISLENILDEAMNNGKTQTRNETSNLKDDHTNELVQTRKGNHSNTQNNLASDISNIHESNQSTHGSRENTLTVPGTAANTPPKNRQLRFLLDPKAQTNSIGNRVHSDRGTFIDQLPHEPHSSYVQSLKTRKYLEEKALPPIVRDNRRSVSTDYLSYYSEKKFSKSHFNEKQRSSSAGKPTIRTSVPLTKIQNSIRLLRNRMSDENFGENVPRLFSENLNVMLPRYHPRANDNEIETDFQPFPVN
jgi:hypothetical protein